MRSKLIFSEAPRFQMIFVFFILTEEIFFTSVSLLNFYLSNAQTLTKCLSLLFPVWMLTTRLRLRRKKIFLNLVIQEQGGF